MNANGLSQNIVKTQKKIINSNPVKAVVKIFKPTLERVPCKGDTLEMICKPTKGLRAKLINFTQKTKIYKFIQKIKKEHNAIFTKEQVEKMVNDFKEYKTENGKNLYNTYRNDLASIIKLDSDKLSQNIPEYCYHGTSEKAAGAIISHGFDSWQRSRMMGNLTRDLGRGIYLSPSKKLASCYGPKVLAVKFDKGKIGYLDSNDWSRYYNRLSSTINDYALEKKLTSSESNVLQNELFGHFLLSGLEIGEGHTKIGGLCSDGMIDFLDVINLRKVLNIPHLNKAEIAIYDPTIIKDIK